MPSFEYMHYRVRGAAHHTSLHVISLFIDGLMASSAADSGWIGSDDIPYGFTTHVESGTHLCSSCDEYLHPSLTSWQYRCKYRSFLATSHLDAPPSIRLNQIMLDEHLLVCKANPNTFKSVPSRPWG
ncbi:hypothetical protein COCMIDRAFT_27820 [Bipolaris oryzae ATCC 44560]|uniref:Uncharacterized protein n=1 Tax=Bipolaris oryzae ATCC 44560 TaxID=930090 RepID=W6YWL4_COCMI|nr:uncharacterized protein COCMIDRAFT_27820 [Bipolaris oryzae ATCC 44560]EUC43762.1 hypothetical protein COCMIDRAFT_27820 [Bipolaris oryzae ATCC 44560]